MHMLLFMTNDRWRKMSDATVLDNFIFLIQIQQYGYYK